MRSTILMSDVQARSAGRNHGARFASELRARLQEVALTCYPWAYVGGWAVTIYLLISLIEDGRLPASIDTYAVRPLLWMSLALMGWIGWREGVQDRPRLSSTVLLSGALAGSFHVAAFMLAGLMFGFGHSPYSHQPLALLGNLIHVGSYLVAFEVSRACILGSLAARRPLLALAVASIFFTLLELPASWAGTFSSPEMGFRFVGETLLPKLSESLLASFLALTGGPAASLVYRGLLHGFEWISPILPRLEWTATAFMGTIVPALGLVLLRGTLLTAAEQDDREEPQAQGISAGWVAVAVFAVTMLWFNTGMFGIRPTIVNGVSMKPALEVGDLVVTREVDPDEVRVGDIIQFRKSGDFILHRVVGVEGTQGSLFFITRGDANNVNDEPVPDSALVGKVVLVIPKLGWLGMAPRLLIQRLGELR